MPVTYATGEDRTYAMPGSVVLILNLCSGAHKDGFMLHHALGNRNKYVALHTPLIRQLTRFLELHDNALMLRGTLDHWNKYATLFSSLMVRHAHFSWYVNSAFDYSLVEYRESALVGLRQCHRQDQKTSLGLPQLLV